MKPSPQPNESSPKMKLSPVRQLAMTFKPFIAHMSVVLLMLFGLAGANMAVPAFLGIMFDDVFPNRLWPLLRMLLVGILVIYVIRNLLFWATKNMSVYIGEQISFELRKLLFERLQSRSLQFYRQANPGKLSSRVMDDSFVIQSFIQDEMPSLLQALCMFSVLFVVLFVINWPLALVSTAILPVHMFAFRYFKKPIKNSSRVAQQHLAILHGSLVEKFLGIEVVKGFAGEERENEKFIDAIDKSRVSQIKSKRYHVMQKIVVDLLVGVSTIALLGFGGYQVMKDDGTAMQPGTFIVFFGYVGMLYIAVATLMNGVAKLTRVSACAERVFEMIEPQGEGQESSSAVVVPIRGDIQFEGAGFTRGRFSCHIPAGKVCVITGPSGSGKSTMVSMIPRLVDPLQGRVLIDGIDARRIDLRHLRESVGIAFQECFLFNTSILENLRYANPEADLPSIMEVTDLVGAHRFISALPDGYDTVVGENGVSLSRGEKQRLVIARALLRNPRILIMDEATASLDTETENQILPAILQYMEGRTVLYVTHRPTLLKYADYAIQLERGSIINQGTPDMIDLRDPSDTSTPAASTTASPDENNRDNQGPGTYKFPHKASILLLAIGLGLACPSGEALAQKGRPAAKPPAKAKVLPPAPAPVSDTPAPALVIEGTGGFYPITGFNDIEADELLDIMVMRLASRFGYEALDATDPNLVGQPPTQLDRQVALTRTEGDAQVILQVGYRAFRSQPLHIWVDGRAFSNGVETTNPDLATITELILEGHKSLQDQYAVLTPGDLASRTIDLSYIEADRCLAILKTLGYETIEYSEIKNGVGGSSIISPDRPIDLNKLPVIVALPNTNSTKLVGSTATTKGTFGETATTPSAASDFPLPTSSAPLMQLMVLYHPAHPEQLSQLMDRITHSVDLPAKQILLEAMILEITESGLKELGVDWEMQAANENLAELTLGRLPTNVQTNFFTVGATATNIFGEFEVRLRALIQEGKAKVLSRPSVLTLDNRQAAIRVGEEIPISSATSGVRASEKLKFDFKYLSIGIMLNILPRVSADNEEVSLQIDGIVSDIILGQDMVLRDSDGQELARAPRISTRRVQTHVRVDNNTPFMIGGLVAEDESSVIAKVPLLGDLPLIGGLFRTETTHTSRNEVIMMITPNVLADDRVVGRNLPKDEDTFDSFGATLFRDAYRIRDEDVFDLNFIKSNVQLQDLRLQVNEAIDNDVRLAEIYPYSVFADSRTPGEHILIYRQVYEVIKRLGIDSKINPENIIFFEADADSPGGSNVNFLMSHIGSFVDVSEIQNFEELTPDDRAGIIFNKLAAAGKALEISYTKMPGDEIRNALTQPVPQITLVDCPDSDTWANRLWDMNQPNDEGHPRQTMLLRTAKDLTRLKRAAVLKRAIRLNGELRLANFSIGRQILMPSIKDEKIYLIDDETANIFFLTEHYYPSFVDLLTKHLQALNETLLEDAHESKSTTGGGLGTIKLPENLLQ